jgi:hypothetical protein
MSQETITRESVAPDADSSLSSSFQLVAQSTDIHGADNFPVGCQFSPDGLCVLTSTGADSQLRLYNSVFIDDASASTTLHPWKTALSVNGGNAVRSYDWFPGMQSSDPGSCCFVATARYDLKLNSNRGSWEHSSHTHVVIRMSEKETSPFTYTMPIQVLFEPHIAHIMHWTRWSLPQ